MAVAVAGEDYPAEGCDGGANERTYHHDPEIGPCFGASEGGTEGAGGIDGAVVDGDPYDVDQAEGEADGQSGKFAESLTCVGGAEHYEAEAEADAEDTDFGSGQHSAAACKEHQKHSSDALSDVFFINRTNKCKTKISGGSGCRERRRTE